MRDLIVEVTRGLVVGLVRQVVVPDKLIEQRLLVRVIDDMVHRLAASHMRMLTTKPEGVIIRLGILLAHFGIGAGQGTKG
ncbi:hypothetical protein D3C76_1784900 [compost metagenome]